MRSPRDLLVVLVETERATRKLTATLPLERKLRRQLARTWAAQHRAVQRALARFAGDFDAALAEAADPTDVSGAVDRAIISDPALVTTVQIVAEQSAARGAAAAQVDLDVTGLWSLEHPEAVEFLTRRGADRVAGIDDVTRRYIRGIVVRAADEGWSYQQTAKAIKERFAEFSRPASQQHLRSRAELVAVTEVGEAYERGSRVVADGLTKQGIALEKRWLTAGDERVCPICGPNEAAGWIVKDRGFPSGQEGPLGHPACRCTTQWRVADVDVDAPAVEDDFGTRPQDTDAPSGRVEWATPAAKRKYGEVLEALDRIHGLHPGDGVPATVVRVGARAVAKGGHFAPHGTRPKVRRRKGETAAEYTARRIEAARQARRPEIVVNPRVGRDDELISFLHEFGHRTDWGNGRFATGYIHQLSEDERNAVVEFLRAATDNDHYRAAKQTALDRGGVAYRQYFDQPIEVWARAYSQWAARKVGVDAAEQALASQQATSAWYSWPNDLFDQEIGPAVEAVLRARRLMQ